MKPKKTPAPRKNPKPMMGRPKPGMADGGAVKKDGKKGCK